MFYRILSSPPGYADHQKYMVARYETLDYKSCGRVKHTNGPDFFATLEEARATLPAHSRRLPFEPSCQFLELWESAEPGAVPSD
jgi:hypothetical protein